MSIWQKLAQRFGASSPPASEDNVIRTQEDVKKTFISLVLKHCARLRSQSPTAVEGLQVLPDSTVEFLSGMAAEKMWLTIQDGEHHSFSITRGTVLYQVSTLSCDLSQVAASYQKDCGGYLNYLTKVFNHPIVTGPGCTTLCHILFGLSHRGSWVQVGVFATSTTEAKKQIGVIPVDILSDDERRALRK